MLQSLRQHATSWVVKILFGLLILSFAMWGINDIFLGERDPAVAKVGGVAITASQLNDAVRQEMERFQPVFGGNLDMAQAKQLGIIDQALERLVDRAVFAQAAQDLGLVVSDEMILRHVHSEPAFRNALGEFDRTQFQQVLMANNLNEERYTALLRRDLATRQLADAVGAEAPVPDTLIESLHRYRGESRTAEVISIPASESTAPPPPDDAALQEFYKANSERFMAPEYRTISYVAIDPAALSEEIAVSDERLKQEYEDRINEFTLRERRNVDQVVLRDEAEAKRVHELRNQGKSLEDALKEAGSKAEIVKLGWVERADLIGELATPVFNLKPGQITEPLRSPLGWHIARVNDAEEGRVRSFEEVRDQLRRDIASHEAADAAHDLSIKLEDALAGGASLEDAANQLGLKATKVPPVAATGLTAEGKAAPSLPSDSNFLRTAFETEEGQESSLIELQGGVLAVLEVDKITPAATKPFDTIKDEIVASWQDEQRHAAAAKRAESILEKIKAGETAAKVAASEKLEVKTTPAFTRLTPETETNLPESVKAQLFELKPGEGASGESREGYVVAVLKDITPAPALTEEQRLPVAEQLSQAIGGDLLDQFAAALRDRYDVEIDRAAIDRRF